MSNTDKLQEKIKEKLNRAIEFEANGFILSVKEVSGLISQLEQAQAENEQLKAVLDETETFIQAISSYRGQNLEVANWHLNGDLEPFDNLLDDNGIDDIMVKIDKTLRARQVLSEVKGNG